jgi:hypothetical protein
MEHEQVEKAIARKSALIPADFHRRGAAVLSGSQCWWLSHCGALAPWVWIIKPDRFDADRDLARHEAMAQRFTMIYEAHSLRR